MDENSTRVAELARDAALFSNGPAAKRFKLDTQAGAGFLVVINPLGGCTVPA